MQLESRPSLHLASGSTAALHKQMGVCVHVRVSSSLGEDRVQCCIMDEPLQPIHVANTAPSFMCVISSIISL